MTYEAIMELFNFLKQIGLVAIGAIIPTISTYITFRRREKVIVKIHIEARAAEELMNSITKCSENLRLISTPLIETLKRYNASIKVIESIKDTAETANYEAKIMESVISDIDRYERLWEDYENNFLKFINVMESKEVIFNKLINYKLLILDENKELEEVYNKIKDVYFLDIYAKVTNRIEVNEEILDLLKEYEAKFTSKRNDILNSFNDLRVSAQNIFFKKLFKYTVPYRDEIPGEKAINKLGFKYKEEENKHS